MFKELERGLNTYLDCIYICLTKRKFIALLMLFREIVHKKRLMACCNFMLPISSLQIIFYEAIDMRMALILS